MASPIREIRRYELLNEGNNHQYNFRLSFTNVTFDGYYKVIGYEEKDNGIINFKVGDYINVDEYIREDKETQPPARYNDGSLIKMLDDIKVGRPSTFASTISVIKKRLFVETINGALHPTEFGKVVLEKLIEGFPDTITEEYTAQVEELLDEISVGKSDYKLLLKEF
ncbi:DNA topoisomerase [Chlamydia abortus]|nr:DNA topoisomerase [Chlamydia abortus]SGA32101.1 DNA topoisomerase [Chlamydia abortus]